MQRQEFLNHINSLSHKHLVLCLKWANGGSKGLGDYMKYTCIDGVTGETIKGKSALQIKVAGMLHDNGQGLIVQKYGDGLAYPEAWLAIQAFIQHEDSDSSSETEERETDTTLAPSNVPKNVPKTDTTDTSSKLTARLLNVGLDRETVIAACVRKSMTDEQWRSVNES